MTAMSAGMVSAQNIHVGPGGVGIGPDHGYGYRDRGDNWRVVITHRRGFNGGQYVGASATDDCIGDSRISERPRRKLDLSRPLCLRHLKTEARKVLIISPCC
jgi:hypothetical protein